MLALSHDRPITTAAIDMEAKLSAFAPILDQMLQQGLVVPSKYQLQCELRSSRAATAEERIADTHIAGGGQRQERRAGGWVRDESSAARVEAVCRRVGDEIRKIGIGKIGVVENIEEVDVELKIHALGQSCSFEDTEIEFLERRPAQAVAAQISKMAGASQAVAVARAGDGCRVAKRARHLEAVEVDAE